MSSKDHDLIIAEIREAVNKLAEDLKRTPGTRGAKLQKVKRDAK